MLNLTYLAVLEPGEDGSYSVSFPDLPGCFSYGDNLTEAQRMAEEAASLHVYGMERDGDEIPTPSLNLPRESTEGNVVTYTGQSATMNALKQTSPFRHGSNGSQKIRKSIIPAFWRLP